MRYLMLLMLAGCATSHPVQPVHETTPPPSDEMEITLRERAYRPITSRESDYAQQDTAIQQEFADQGLQLQMCWEVYGKRHPRCISMRVEFCRVDAAVLHSGQVLRKEFCR